MSTKDIWCAGDRILHISDWLSRFHKLKILEIGIGEGNIVKLLSNNNEVFALDINRELLIRSRYLSANSYFIYADGRNLPFKCGAFDAVICREVVEHMSKKEGINFIREINRVLKRNGVLLISTPNTISLEGLIGLMANRFLGKKWEAWNSSHKYIYNTFEFKRVLKNTNFNVIQLKGEYYLSSNLYNMALMNYYLYIFFRNLRRFTDEIFGNVWPFSNFGFVIEYYCINKS